MVSYGDIWADIYDDVHGDLQQIPRLNDIPFWVEEVKSSKGLVLELGCGTGRVAIPIAEAGIPIVGLDNSASMLRIARGKVRKLGLPTQMVQFVHGDMRTFKIEKKFDSIIIPFRSFLLLLSVAEQRRTLATIKHHLSPGGRLIFNAFIPDLETFRDNAGVLVHDYHITNPETGYGLVVSHQNQYDHFNQIINTRTIIERVGQNGKIISSTWRDYQLRYMFRFEVLHLLEASGYRILDTYGGYDRSPIEDSSEEMIWVATHRQ